MVLRVTRISDVLRIIAGAAFEKKFAANFAIASIVAMVFEVSGIVVLHTTKIPIHEIAKVTISDNYPNLEDKHEAISSADVARLNDALRSLSQALDRDKVEEEKIRKTILEDLSAAKQNLVIAAYVADLKSVCSVSDSGGNEWRLNSENYQKLLIVPGSNGLSAATSSVDYRRLCETLNRNDKNADVLVASSKPFEYVNAPRVYVTIDKIIK